MSKDTFIAQIFNQGPFWSTLVLSFILPLFIIPTSLIAPSVGKGLVLYVVVTIGVVLCVLGVLRKGTFSLPRTWVLVAAGVLPVVYIISALASGSFVASFFGQSVNLGVVAVLFSGVALLFLIPAALKTNREIFYVYLTILVSVVLLILFHVIRLIFGADTLTFGVLTNNTASLIGSWNAFAITLGLVVLLILATSELLRTPRWFSVMLYGVAVVALLFLALIHFQVVWYVLGLLSLLLLLYKFSSTDDDRRLSIPTLGVVVISAIFIVAGGFFSDTLSEVFGTSNIDVRPGARATLIVAGETLKEKPLLGVGPGQFSEAWTEHKPRSVNRTPFWSTVFTTGVGFIPSTLVTTGILGFVAWVVFLILFLYRGVVSAFYGARDRVTRFLLVSSFIASVYLWVLHVVYTPGVVLSVLAFLFSGIFVSVLYREGVIPTVTIVFRQKPSYNFVVTSGAVASIILFGVLVYGASVWFGGSVLYGSGVQSITEGNTEKAARKLTQSLALFETDYTYRALAQTGIVELSRITSDTETAQEVLQSRFQTVLQGTVGSAQRAVALEEDDFLNWVILGRVYEQLVPLGVDGVYDQAHTAYTRAQERNPNSPDIELLFARLEALSGNNELAREHIRAALELKPDYTDAVFLLSQIQVAEGNVDDAIASVEAATLISPTNPTVFFQLGLLRYARDDFSGAVGAFENAVVLNPVYANAKYFLGLSYYELGRRFDAIAQFEDVLTLNPGNEEVEFILDNLENGRAPFANVAPPLDTQPPEERDEPPVEEAVGFGE